MYSEKENVDQCDHALASLIKSMQWDEEQTGRVTRRDHARTLKRPRAC